MKMLTTSATASPAFRIDAATLAGVSPIPVGQALTAIGLPRSTTELAQRLGATVAMIWEDLSGADLFLPHGGSGELRGVRDADAGRGLLSAVASPVSSDPAVRVISATPHLVPPDLDAGRGASMSAPIVSSGSAAGAAPGALGAIEGFVIVQKRPAAPAFTSADLQALAAIGRGLGELLPRVRAPGHVAGSEWLQRDMRSAREMQRMFLPQPTESNSANVRMLAEYVPAYDVGGDFYDFVDLGGGRLLATIGDVSGKGVTAALMMSRISSELHRLAAETSGPAELLGRLNRSLRGMQDDRFVTAACVLLDVPNRRWVVANAGHVVPILRRRSGVVSGLAYSSGPPVGMLANAEYQDEVFTLEPCDILLLATDGVFEMLSGPRRPCSTVGHCKLTDVVQRAPHDLGEIHRRILTALESVTTGRDDVALLGLELRE